MMTTQETLLALTEWLDGAGHLDLDAPPSAVLVEEFLAAWSGDLLAGQTPPECPACNNSFLAPDGYTPCPACQKPAKKATTGKASR